MNSQRKRFIVLVAVLGLGLGVGWMAPTPEVGAQTNDEVNAAIQFNFVNPGARSLSMGGAFLGLADDATAAYTNPAGLAQLSIREVSAETRGWRFTHRFADRGHFEGEPTEIGVDTIAGLEVNEATNDVTGLSFLSYVYPATKKLCVAFYYHQLANFEANFATQGPFQGEAPFLSRIRPIDTSLDLQIQNFGGSGAFSITEDFSIGLGVSWYDFELQSRTNRFDFIDTNVRGDNPGGFFGPRDPNGTIANFQTQSGDDSAIGANLGFLWRPSGKRWQVGGVYRRGPDFELDVRSFVAPSTLAEDETATFHLPDVLGVGIALQATENWKITFDYNHVEYSTLTEDFVALFGVPDPEGYEVDDGNEYHLGFEYRFPQRKYPFRVRFGGWQEPEHQIQYTGVDQTERALWGIGNDEAHLTFGLGVVLFNDRLEINGAGDFSDRVDTVSVSAVWRFLER